jgi:diguanylate cyclase (GGDEF)-like protein
MALRNRAIAFKWVLGLLLLSLVLALPADANQEQARRFIQRAEALAQKQRIPEATKAILSAVDAAPDWDVPQAALARFYMGIANRDGAAKAWREAIKRSPKNPAYHQGLAEVLTLKGDLEGAAAAWRSVADLRPKDSNSRYNLAQIALEQGDLDIAETQLALAEKLEPGAFKFSLLQARIDLIRKDYRAVRVRLEDMLRLIPEQHKEIRQQAQALLDQANQESKDLWVQRGIYFGIPLILIVAGYVTWKITRWVEIKAPPSRLDPSTNESICRFALTHVAALTGLPRALCWVVSLDGRRMELAASELMKNPGPLARRDLDRGDLVRWIKEHGPVPFLYKLESQERRFLDAFPDLVKNLEGVEINVGVPLVWKGEFRGLLLLGRSRSAGGRDLRSRFEKNSGRVQGIAEQAAQALDELRKEHLKIYDVETGVHNRAYFDVYLSEAVQTSRSTRLPLTLLIMRMDAFDEIQEKYGDNLSGEILEQMLDAIFDRLREESKTVLFRLEGGVFALVALERGLREAPSLAQHLKAAIDGLKISRNLPRPTGCVAFGVYPDHADDCNALRRVTMRAFRDAVYLEGNRVLEAERGGAFDPDEEVEAGIRVAGRRALTEDPPPSQIPPPSGPAPFQPFTTARRAEAPAPEGGVSGTFPQAPEDEGASAEPTGEKKSRWPASRNSSSETPGRLTLGSSLRQGRPAPPPVRPIPIPQPPIPPPGAAPKPASPGLESDLSDLADLGIDPETQFCLQPTFEDLAEFEVRSGLDSGQTSSILYLRLANLEELRSGGDEDALKLRRNLASLLHAFLRDEVDVPGLMGADDFVLLLTGTSLRMAVSQADQVAMTVRNLQVAGQVAVPAIGVAASSPEDPVEGLELIQRARSAAAQGPGVHQFGEAS